MTGQAAVNTIASSIILRQKLSGDKSYVMAPFFVDDGNDDGDGGGSAQEGRNREFAGNAFKKVLTFCHHIRDKWTPSKF